jgi:hypothetical protein
MCCNRYHLFPYADLGSDLRCTVFLFANKLSSSSFFFLLFLHLSRFRPLGAVLRVTADPTISSQVFLFLSVCIVMLFGSLLSSIFSMWTVCRLLYFQILPTTLTTPSCTLMVSLQILTYSQVAAYHLLG